MANRVRASKRGARDYSDSPLPKISRSIFDRSHTVHTAFNAGDLVPVDREELLPGDTIKIRPAVFARLTTMEVPIFSNVYMDVHYFAVPIRLLWDNAEEFFGAEPDGPGTRTDFTTPKLDCTAGVTAESLFDYIGIPPGVPDGTSSRWPHNFYGRAYSRIFNDWYRDAEIEAPVTQDTDNGPDDPADYPIRKRNKQRDRFTSARPWPYKGPDINISLGTSAPVTISSSGAFQLVGPTSGDVGYLHPRTGGISVDQVDIQSTGGGIPWFTAGEAFQYSSGLSASADLSSAIGPTVNDLRNNIATQHLFEMFARGGSARYVELNETVFGVRSPDSRLQRAEYIGGCTAKLYTTPVAATSAIAASATELGDLGALGVAAGGGRAFSYSAVEHCVVLGIASVRTEYLYSQGLDKDLQRDTRFDYFWPAFQALGEQPIANDELVYVGASTDEDVFGYEPRYQEYRERMNMVTGKLRPQHATTLAYWHLGQEFSGAQNLNKTFIQEDPPFDRVTTITAATEPTFKVDLFVDQKHIRPISAQGRPGLMRL